MKVVEIVSEVTGVPSRKILGACQKNETRLARKMCYASSTYECRCTREEVGCEMNVDRSSVSTGLSRHWDEYYTDARGYGGNYDLMYDEVIRRLRNNVA